jgi:hypothetical protein
VVVEEALVVVVEDAPVVSPDVSLPPHATDATLSARTERVAKSGLQRERRFSRGVLKIMKKRFCWLSERRALGFNSSNGALGFTVEQGSRHRMRRANVPTSKEPEAWIDVVARCRD